MILHSMGGHEFADGKEMTGVFVRCGIAEFRGVGAMLGEDVEIVLAGEVSRLRAELEAEQKDRARIIAERDGAILDLTASIRRERVVEAKE